MSLAKLFIHFMAYGNNTYAFETNAFYHFLIKI